jgi:hypothetical protein
VALPKHYLSTASHVTTTHYDCYRNVINFFIDEDKGKFKEWQGLLDFKMLDLVEHLRLLTVPHLINLASPP